MSIDNLWTTGGIISILLLEFSQKSNREARLVGIVTVVRVMDRLRQVPGAKMAIATDRE